MNKELEYIRNAMQEAIAIPFKKIFFTETGSLPETANPDKSQNLPLQRITIPLEHPFPLSFFANGQYIEHHLVPGEAVFIQPGTWCTLKPDSKVKFRVISLVLYPKLLRFVVSGDNLNWRIYYHLQDSLRHSTTEYLYLLSSIGKCLDPENAAPHLLRLFLTAALNDLAHTVPILQKSSLNLYQRIIMFLHEHFTEDLMREDVAAHFCISPNYLSRLFHLNGNGDSFNEVLNNLRLEMGRSLLPESNLSCAEIAMRCGFNDPSYFTRRFRQKYGIAPDRYRRNNN